MVLDIALFVSERLQPVAAALLCLVAAQCAAELMQPTPAVARIAVTR